MNQEKKSANKLIVDKKRISNRLRYLTTKSELAAYFALPTILEKGTIVYQQSNHKGIGYGTITIAAPIEINSVRGNMGASIRLDSETNCYKVHRILILGRNTFVYETKKKQ